MFSFFFDHLSDQPKDWELIINGYSIKCSKKNAEIISKKVSDFNLKNPKNNESFKITIPSLSDPLLCSESDYKYFDNVFNLEPIHISSQNKNFLKIFSEEFEIKELSNLIEMLENTCNIISNDETILIQKEMSDRFINLTNENFDEFINFFVVYYDEKKNESDDDRIISNQFLYHIVLKACSIRSQNIELIINFLKKIEEKTNRNQFKYFKEKFLSNFDMRHFSNSFFFIIRYLHEIHEIDKETIKEKFDSIDFIIYELISSNYECLLFDKDELFVESKILKYKNSFFRPFVEIILDKIPQYNKDELLEYVKNGYSPSKFYQSIKNDDILTFSELIKEKSNDGKFNDTIQTLFYERNNELYDFFKENVFSYINLACIYGSEKVFNFIMMNSEPTEILNEISIAFALIGGNISIIYKCIEIFPINDTNIYKYIILTIKYHHNEVFEWLIESYNSNESKLFNNLDKNKEDKFDESILIQTAIEFNNYDALFYLLSIGIDYTSLFSISIYFKKFYLAKLAANLQYNCNDSSPNIKRKKTSPFLYKYKEILFFFYLIKCPYLLQLKKITLIL